ncbi:MAG TPA: TetR/AcrR family transcriptional regulator [Candidatus Limnocylindrales bacterium]|nr:TetR/AcrR family transcriptional regulator [Candidatus Limnocylindrales bacterium]
MSDTTASPTGSDRGLSRRELTDTRGTILEAARNVLLQDGYARLSTRRVAELADVPLSQIHYHFGSKQQLILGVLRAENARLLDRQAEMYAGPEPLWRQWERACDFLEVDLESGYVRILQEMVAAGWSDAEVAAEVRSMLGGWHRLLADVATRESERVGGLGPFTPGEIAALMGIPFLGAESSILLGFTEADLPIRSALRKIGVVIRQLEESGRLGDDAG